MGKRRHSMSVPIPVASGARTLTTNPPLGNRVSRAWRSFANSGFKAVCLRRILSGASAEDMEGRIRGDECEGIRIGP